MKLKCEQCGDNFMNHNPKVKLCPKCNPNSMRRQAEKDDAMRAAEHDHYMQFDGHQRRKFLPE